MLNPQRMEPIIRRYYANTRLKPLSGALVELQLSGRVPSSGIQVHVFSVLHPQHPRGFTMSAEWDKDRYRIDWESYIQWRDQWLATYLAGNVTTPETFFVVLRRSHYFDSDVPDSDKKLCFRLTSAVPGDEGTLAFVEKETALGLTLENTYEWRKIYYPVVELQRVTGEGHPPYITIARIVRPTWRRTAEVAD